MNFCNQLGGSNNACSAFMDIEIIHLQSVRQSNTCRQPEGRRIRVCIFEGHDFELI